jgi:hypothetical protein
VRQVKGRYGLCEGVELVKYGAVLNNAERFLLAKLINHPCKAGAFTGEGAPKMPLAVKSGQGVRNDRMGAVIGTASQCCLVLQARMDR